MFKVLERFVAKVNFNNITPNACYEPLFVLNYISPSTPFKIINNMRRIERKHLIQTSSSNLDKSANSLSDLPTTITCSFIAMLKKCPYQGFTSKTSGKGRVLKVSERTLKATMCLSPGGNQ
ncbi:hypothetical protein Hanom_Chr09g00833151 [Helianthus anomalus]